MATGEALKDFGVFAAIGLMGWLMIEAGARLGAEWAKLHGGAEGPKADPTGIGALDDARAEALIPGFAAERRCTCRACRTRHLAEPCSDYDGD